MVGGIGERFTSFYKIIPWFHIICWKYTLFSFIEFGTLVEKQLYKHAGYFWIFNSVLYQWHHDEYNFFISIEIW